MVPIKELSASALDRKSQMSEEVNYEETRVSVRRVFVLSVFVMVSNGVDTCEVAQYRFDDGCWRLLCPYQHSGRGRAAMWARVWLTLAAVETERLAPQESTWRQEPEGEAEVPKIIVVSSAVRGTKVDVDGKGLLVEQIVDLPVPQIAAKIPEVVDTISQEHISDDLLVPQVGLTETRAAAERRES